MFISIFVLLFMGLILGAALGFAAKIFKVESDPLVEEIIAMMPGTQCGQCGFPGCTPAAEAIASGDVDITCCPPGGKSLAENLADKLNISVDLSNLSDVPLYAQIDPDLCTGCTRCFKACPTDAVLGANKQIHSVITAACTGCGKCQAACPENCINMAPETETLDNWQWPKPRAA